MKGTVKNKKKSQLGFFLSEPSKEGREKSTFPLVIF